MRQIAALIVRFRYAILALFVVLCVYAGCSIGKVQISTDLTEFLPETTETRQGLVVMNEEFLTYGSASIMISNVSYDTARELADEIESYPHVASVSFDDTSEHYKGASALLSVSFDGSATDEGVMASYQRIMERLERYDVAVSSTVGSDLMDQLATEMGGVMLIAIVVIVGVLLFTSRSYFEVVVFFIVFAVAALLNMGTNYWLGTISSITNSIAIILQLALAIDYAIIFAHRYQDEANRVPDAKEALISALAKAIAEISSSSLTTISGLVAITLMQFRLGYDLGVVLSKGILCSMLTVFLLMPSLILLFARPIKKLQHRSLIPNLLPWGKILMKSKYVFVFLFVLVIPFGIYGAGQVNYVFSAGAVDPIVRCESFDDSKKIEETFGSDTVIAVLVPSGDYEAEKEILAQVADLEHIKSTFGLSGIEIVEGKTLTDPFTAQSFSELTGIDKELSGLLFSLYGAEHQQYQPIFGDVDQYAVPLLDLLLYTFEKIDQGFITLEGDAAEQIVALRPVLESAVEQLKGENWNRLIITTDLPVEGEESVALVAKIRAIAVAQAGEDVLVIGDITSARDLKESFYSDSTLTNVLTILFVFLILLATFRSLVGSAVLVFVIQGSIWINFACAFLSGMHTFFVTQIIVSAIQMGATIDYAIVLMSRYQALKQQFPPKEAMAHAVAESFPTILTSGAIMTVAGFVIGYGVTDVYIGHIGLAVGRGAFISI
ncbi:MAG: RND family transporter, partial [Christensenellaceae bacterium]